MLDEGGDDDWSFRRDTNIRRPFERAVCCNADGIPYLAPEIQLLYKSNSIRPKDQIDFDAVVGFLDKDARAWLRNSLAMMNPNHVWLSRL